MQTICFDVEIGLAIHHSTVDVLWGQPIKQIQVVSTSEFHEY